MIELTNRGGDVCDSGIIGSRSLTVFLGGSLEKPDS